MTYYLEWVCSWVAWILLATTLPTTSVLGERKLLAKKTAIVFDVVTPALMTTCKAADWDGQTFFRGLECHMSNIWRKACPLVGACEPACSRCIAWRRGVLPLAESASALQTELQRASGDSVHFFDKNNDNHHISKLPCGSGMWSMGSWVTPQPPASAAPSPLLPTTSADLPFWQPAEAFAQSCPSGLLPQGRIYQCLRGKRVMLLGDSMIRPLIGRLIAYLRGQPQYIDHIYHGPGSYYLANGTHDAFVEGDFLPSLRAAEHARNPGHEVANRPSMPEDTWDPASTMEFQFYWAPHFERYEVDGEQEAGLLDHVGIMDGADIIIAGPMYHDNGHYEHFPGLLMQLFQQQHATTGRRVSNFFWVASLPRQSDSIEIFRPRNLRMRTFVEALNDASLADTEWAPRRSFYVDTELLASSAPVQRSKNNNHFQCNTPGVYPERVSEDKNRVTSSSDCRDPFNLSVLHSILKVACNE